MKSALLTAWWSTQRLYGNWAFSFSFHYPNIPSESSTSFVFDLTIQGQTSLQVLALGENNMFKCLCVTMPACVCVCASCWSAWPKENYRPPRSDKSGHRGTGDSQFLPDLLTPTHTHTPTHIHTPGKWEKREWELERGTKRLIVRLSNVSHPNRGGCQRHRTGCSCKK